ncbi:MAG TPA: acyl-CoA dehydrogenase, partial [Pseudonocardiaceae bacterium]|nr:acyl-CoA dehydrogenase [Pseudonocardiaceae bacterium]
FEGSTEIMELLIAREAVDTHLAVAGDIIDPRADTGRKARAAARAGGFYAKWLPGLAVGRGQVPTGYREFGPLAEHLRYVERASRKLARQTFYGMSRWQGKLEHRQCFLGRIVNIGAELFAISAACVRAQRLREEHGDSAVELADAFCRQARHRADELFERLWHNTDSTDRKLARGVLEGRYTWLEDGVIDPSVDGPWIADATPGESKRPNVRRRLR